MENIVQDGIALSACYFLYYKASFVTAEDIVFIKMKAFTVEKSEQLLE
jgi:hypothetical protein